MSEWTLEPLAPSPTDRYADADEMAAYVADRPEAALWDALDEDEQEAILIYVSGLVDALPFTGRKYDTSQPLQWPRLIKTRQGWRVERDADDNVVVPQPIKDAVCEEILARLDTTNDARRALQEAGVKSFRLSDLSESYGDDLQGGGIKGTPLRSWTAYRLLEPYLSTGARAV